MYIYIYICIRVYIYIHIYIYTYTCDHISFQNFLRKNFSTSLVTKRRLKAWPNFNSRRSGGNFTPQRGESSQRSENLIVETISICTVCICLYIYIYVCVYMYICIYIYEWGDHTIYGVWESREYIYICVFRRLMVHPSKRSITR